MSRNNRLPVKDMYWFAHGGTESEKPPTQVDEDVHVSGSPTWNVLAERKGSPDDQKSPFVLKDYSHTDGGSNSSGPSSLEKDDRLHKLDKRTAVEERRKQLLEAEQERHDAVLRKHMERDAALEARRNAQRSHIAFAFGSSVPRNVDALQVNEAGDADLMTRSFTASGLSQKEETHNFYERRSISPLNYSGNSSGIDKSHVAISCNSERKGLSPPSWLVGSGAVIGDDVMSKSMNASMLSAPRGRRKNDLMPTVPYERTTPTPRAVTTSSTRKRSVSMTRLDQLALPRKHYVEANKASSAASSGASSVGKDNIRSPSRPLSSASENSGGSGRIASSVTRRVRSSPRKPRPISIAGTIPDQSNKPFEPKVSPIKRSYTPKKTTEVNKTDRNIIKCSTPKTAEKVKTTPRPSTATKLNPPKTTTPKAATPKASKQTESKPSTPKSTIASKTPTPKVKEKKSQPIKKKTEAVVASPVVAEVKNKSDETETQNENTTPVDNDAAFESEKNNAKRIISEEEAKAALAEKRRLAREQAERDAELERQRQEELRLAELEELRREEEEHRKMEEEQIRLLEEHRRQEEEKLRKAIEDQELKEEEERTKRDEESRMKAEQEKKAKEEAEKQRLELEEKLRKEEEERAERKKRLEKIMSRTRGKSNGTSPSGSVSGSDQLDSGDNPQESFSSGANSLESNGDISSDQASVDDHPTKAEISSAGNSMEANPTYEIESENESLNSNDLMMPLSETASQDNSLTVVPEKLDAHQERQFGVDVSSTVDDTSHIESSKVQIPDVVDGEPIKSSACNEDGASGNNIIDVTTEIQTEVKVSENNHISESNPSNILEIHQHHENEELFNQHLGNTDSYATSDSGLQFQQNTDYMFHEDDVMQKLPDADVSNQELPDTITHCSTSSDIKLPDPIYETSDEGSVSSEKLQGPADEFSYSTSQDVIAASDDVFSEQLSHSNQQNLNPFGTNMFEKQNPFANNNEYAFQNLEVDTVNGDDSIHNMTESQLIGAGSNVGACEVEIEEDIPSRSSTSSVIEADLGGVEFSQITHGFSSQGLTSNLELSNKVNPFSNDEIMSAYGIQEVPASASIIEKDDLEGHFETRSAEDNPFSKTTSQLNPFCLPGGDGNVFQQHSFVETEQTNPTMNMHDFSNTDGVDEVTVIKADDSGACIGIISSIDHDQVANELTKTSVHSEQFKSNFEYASITDSEDNSSLDSNSSQIRTEEKNTNGGLNTVVSQFVSNGSIYSNGDQQGSTETKPIYNHDSISSVNTFSASEVITNGHSLDTSKHALEHVNELLEYGQLEGNGILSVDHSQNNIFENVDALEYGKVSPDPFLSKGNSKQISGNPFHLQDDQKQVLMTSDFLN